MPNLKGEPRPSKTKTKPQNDYKVTVHKVASMFGGLTERAVKGLTKDKKK